MIYDECTLLSFLLIVISFLLFSCTYNNNKEEITKKEKNIQTSDTLAYFYIENNIRDFGTINKKKQDSVIVSFEFCNTGQKSFVLIKSDPSCSCMETKIPQEPIVPGESGKIVIKVDLQNQEGKFNKNVMIKSNAQNDVILLRIKGNIK